MEFIKGTKDNRDLNFDYSKQKEAINMDTPQAQVPPQVPQEKIDQLKEIARERVKSTRTMKQALENRVRSIQFGVVGVGQAGSKIAEQFYKFGYPACVINTASQDLTLIAVPEENKLHIDYALGGAGKDLALGEQAISSGMDKIDALLKRVIEDKVDSAILTIGLGGGTGAGSVIPMIEAIARTGVPIVVLCALPMANEGSLAKANAIKTLDKIARIAASGHELIQTLIVVDNSRIEEMYPQIAAGRFWEVANFDIANTLHMFNTLTACDSRYASLDPTDFTKILTAGNCTIYGKMEVPILVQNGEITMSEDELARAVTQNVEKGLLAEGFNIKETTRAGVLVAASQSILNLIPAVNINYAFDALTEALGGASLFHGIYEDDNDKNIITVYTMLSGIGLPRERVDKLLQEAEEDLQVIEQKQADKSKMQVFDQNQTVEREKTSYQKMKDRNTTFGRMIANKQRRSRG